MGITNENVYLLIDAIRDKSPVSRILELGNHLSCFKMTWAEIKNNNPGINIINSSGGSLECFPRVKLDTIL